MHAQQPSRRRGVVILIVLSLLVLFALIAVTFAIVAGQYLRSARAAARLEQMGDPPNALLDQALYQVLSGPERGNVQTPSALCGHSLLRDLYGASDSISGTATGVTVVDGQLLDVACSGASGFRPIPGYYNGCVFTMTAGIAAGYSSRIIAYTPTISYPATGIAAVSSCTFRIELMESDRQNLASQLLNTTAQSDAFVNKPFVVNGRPNNGAGFGYNPATNNLTNDALLPNYAKGRYVDSSGKDQLPNGDTDEGFDVPDYRDMWLSYIPLGASQSAEVVPSFHKPDLIWYWKTAGVSNLSRACLRPLPTDHPNFSGSNPYLDPAVVNTADEAARRLAGVLASGQPDPACRWDVDNDRDGVYDSVWLDLGLPAKADRNGRQYKPLFAILIRDLDGRLNLNAHGNVRQNTADYTGDASGTFAGGGTSVASPPRGHGHGPAEINLVNFLSSLGYNSGEIDAIIALRYGADGVPGVTTDEKIALFKTQGLPTDYASALSGWGSPPDVWGRGAELLDPDGQGQFFFEGRAISTSGTLINERQNSPYELNLVRPNTSDTPFTLAEYERYLRPYDADSHNLPNRLWDEIRRRSPTSAPVNFADAPTLAYLANFQSVTPASFDVPNPMTQFPQSARALMAASGNQTALAGLFESPKTYPENAKQNYPSASSIADLFAARLLMGGVAKNNVAAQLSYMLPLELSRGQRFNVNRLWGNGRDDNSNGTVDEPSEVASENVFGTADGNASTAANYANDYPGPATASAASDKGRQMYARYLYCLAMALVDDNYYFPLSSADSDIGGSPSNAIKLELKARRLAQWAVNCVDYRDPDSIMTPFEYDINPWNGWDVDGNLATTGAAGSQEVVGGNNITTTERRLVWGMEYPDLVLRESKAVHDRRVADKAIDTGGASDHARKKADGTAGDTTLDQYGVPQGSLFLELYCPRSPLVYDSSAPNAQRSVPPKDLYTYATSGTQTLASLDLARLSPATAGGLTYPVWRVGVSEQHYGTASKSAFDNSTSHAETITFQPGELNVQGELNALVPGVGGATSRTVALDRVIWFANLNPAGSPAFPTPGRIYYNRFATAGAGYLLPGGSYAVVGPRAVTRFGGRNDNTPSGQRVVLASSSVTVYDMASNPVDPGVSKKAALGILAAANPPSTWSANAANLGAGASGTGVGISVSEPRPLTDAGVNSYYPAPDGTMTGWTANVGEGNSYVTAKDYPFDHPDANDATKVTVAADRVATPLQANANLRTTGTKEDFCTAYLQRLANPLAPYDATTNPYITVDWLPVDLTVFNGADKKPAAWDNNTPAGIGDWDRDDPNPGTPKFATRERDGNATTNLWSTHLNTPVASVAGGAGSDYFPYNLVQTLGYLNAGFGSPLATPAAYIGSPSTPFPWLTWANRPYHTPLELMHVPNCSQARMLHEFSLANTTDNPYTGGTAVANTRAPFSHLFNFFQSTPLNGSGVPDSSQGASELCRLFDYLEVPSPFAGTERWYDPTTLTSGNVTLKAPFNNFSRFREPGKVNLNTIADKRVLQAVLGIPDSEIDALWPKFWKSRQGYAPGSPPALDATFPSRFAHPFCSAAAADLATTTNMRYKGVDATLLRPDPDAASSPLFLGTVNTQVYRDGNRNPALLYSRLERLANLTTTRSNVFAVWITVGYFEFDPVSGTLGGEIGWDTGESQRHRAFFMIDRSLPVAFVPGEIHNIDRCVQVRRYLE